MQKQLILALADVLNVDLRDLAELSEAQQLARLEQMQALAVASL